MTASESVFPQKVKSEVDTKMIFNSSDNNECLVDPTEDQKNLSKGTPEGTPAEEEAKIALGSSSGTEEKEDVLIPIEDQKKAPTDHPERASAHRGVSSGKDSKTAPDTIPVDDTRNNNAASIAGKTVSADSSGDKDKTILTVDQKKPPPSNGRKSSGGLSELSKQLRVLQAKNQAQSVEIDRLERQLRILADLQGISVSDLRKALQEACEAEAFGELQNRVAALRAQLEAASLAKQRTAASEDAAASAHKIANLELRIGELEEVEEKQRAEIQDLYSQLMERKANVTRLEALCEHQRSENERLKEQTKAESQETTTHKVGILQSEQSALLEKKARDAEVEVQVLKERLALSEQQREATEEQSKLRHAQFKARFMVQDEKIQDLEQQLSSLYTAFEMLREERTQEEATRVALQSSLHAADAQVARDLDSSTRSETLNSSVSHIIPESPAKEVTKSITHVEGDPVISGSLLVRSNNFLKKWKQRQAVLSSTLASYNLHIVGGEFGGLYQLQFGVSTVEPSHKQQHAFIIRVDPNNNNAATVHAAALNAQEYHQWMAALTAATTGEEYNARDDSNVENSMNFTPSEDESYQEHRVL